MGGSRVRACITAVSIGVALLATGCGGHASSKPFATQFQDATAAYQSRMTAVQSQARTALKSHQASDELSVYRDLLSATDRTIAQFRALHPPASAQTAFAALVQALQAQDQALKDILDAANSGDATRLTSAVQSYGTALAQWQQQRTQVEDALTAGSATAGSTS